MKIILIHIDICHGCAKIFKRCITHHITAKTFKKYLFYSKWYIIIGKIYGHLSTNTNIEKNVDFTANVIELEPVAYLRVDIPSYVRYIIGVIYTLRAGTKWDR